MAMILKREQIFARHFYELKNKGEIERKYITFSQEIIIGY
jgi:hypothetical protein